MQVSHAVSHHTLPATALVWRRASPALPCPALPYLTWFVPDPNPAQPGPNLGLILLNVVLPRANLALPGPRPSPRDPYLTLPGVDPAQPDPNLSLHLQALPGPAPAQKAV